MKKIYLIIGLIFSALIANSQVFWTENFGTGCNQGTLASAYTGTNGAWFIGPTGANDSYANTFYVSGTEKGTGLGNCGTVCGGTDNATLHVGSIAIPGFVTADAGASYNAGGICGIGYCVITNRRAESPVINCTGQSSITISCAYFENGATTLDDASLSYSADGGTTWTLLNNMAKTPLGSCAPQGMWTAYSFALPASANNNAFVKIGFNWTNDDDAAGSDPSFAVDDITLSSGSVGIADMEYASPEVYTSESNIIIKTSDLVKLNGVYDVLGRSIVSSFENNMINMEGQPAGIYFVRIEVKGQTYTKKVYIK
ncbi:MAG TPA: T9SS type A sorting domain-containing protein [Bacteroidia bacterium]